MVGLIFSVFCWQFLYGGFGFGRALSQHYPMGCMELVAPHNSKGNWNNIRCNRKRYPICHLPPTPEQYGREWNGKRWVMTKTLLELAKETLNHYNDHDKQFLVYMFGELGKDSMSYLGGIDIVATALAGSTYIS